MFDLVKGTAAETVEFTEWYLGGFKKLGAKDRVILDQLVRDGVVVLKNYFSQDRAKELRQRVVELTQKDDKLWVDPKGSDHRLFGVDRRDEMIAEFQNDPWLRKLGEAYCRKKISSGFTLAGRLEYVPENSGSGDGWHRDSPIRRQFKAICYLTEVSPENGPFEYLKGSHRKPEVLKLIYNGLQRFRQYRFSQKEVEEIVQQMGLTEQNFFCGEPGDVILVDTKGIHRGCPIRKGQRVALTNYYFTGEVPEHFQTLF